MSRVELAGRTANNLLDCLSATLMPLHPLVPKGSPEGWPSVMTITRTGLRSWLARAGPRTMGWRTLPSRAEPRGLGPVISVWREGGAKTRTVELDLVDELYCVLLVGDAVALNVRVDKANGATVSTILSRTYIPSSSKRVAAKAIFASTLLSVKPY